MTNRDWFKVTEGDGEWAVPDPTNQRLIWADSENGEIVLYDRVSHEATNIKPYRGTAQEDFVLANSRYRFNWESPIAFAEYDPHVAFIGANVLFETNDNGKHWKAISPDLTRNDKSKQQVAKDSVTHDESGAENYGYDSRYRNLAAHKGEIWTGSDDGLVYVTRSTVGKRTGATLLRPACRRTAPSRPLRRRRWLDGTASFRPTGTRWATCRRISS